MPRKASSFTRKKREDKESLLALPRLLAMVGICALAAAPFLPWLASAAKGAPVTLKELTTQMVGSGVLTVNLWLFPIVLAVLFLLPLLTDLRLTRAIYYMLLIEILVVAAFFLYPSIRGLLFEAGISARVPALKYGFYVFLCALALIMFSAVSTLWQTRLGIAVLTMIIAFTAIIIAGNLTSWFGYLTGEPRMWHEEYEARVPDGQALGVHLNILNDGWGRLRLGLAPPTKPREVDFIISAQRHYRVGDYWADTTLDSLMTEKSRELLPAEVEPGNVLMLNLIFGPLTSADALYSLPSAGASGSYNILISDPEGRRIYRHLIDVPPAVEPVAAESS